MPRSPPNRHVPRRPIGKTYREVGTIALAHTGKLVGPPGARYFLAQATGPHLRPTQVAVPAAKAAGNNSSHNPVRALKGGFEP